MPSIDERCGKRVWRRMLLTSLALAFVGLMTGGSLEAQDAGVPSVGFVVNSDLGTASHTDPGGMGLSRLAEVFGAYGAPVETIDLDTPIPEHIGLIVIIRPVRPFTIPQVARLWIHLQKGNNLLLALDPENYYIGFANISPQIARSGLTALLMLDYGILIREAFLVEPWFTTSTITDLDTSFSRTFVDVVPHPVVSTLSRFNVPVWVWGARALTIEPFGVDSQAVPLLYNNRGYGESSTAVFRVLRGNRFENATAPLQADIAGDLFGWINVAALAENTSSGSRIVILGDSEMLENAYGFAGSDQARRYPGNVVFAHNIGGWLLELPANQWLPLPAGFTWLTIDGSAQEWPESASATQDAVDAGVSPELDIQQVRAFHDDAYAYVFVETWERPPADARVSLRLNAEDGQYNIEVSPNGLSMQDRVNSGLESANTASAIRSGMEVRIPWQLVSQGIDDLCLRSPATADIGIADCLGQPVPVPAFNTRAPFDPALADGILVTVSNNTEVNLRSGPSTATQIVTTLPTGTVLAAIGRNTDGTWIRVENSSVTGWISSGLIVANGDILLLRIAEAQE